VCEEVWFVSRGVYVSARKSPGIYSRKDGEFILERAGEFIPDKPEKLFCLGSGSHRYDWSLPHHCD